MGRLDNAMNAQLGPGEKPSVVCKGTSSGLNGTARANRTDAMLYVLPGKGVLVGRLKIGIINTPVVERFGLAEIMEVREGDAARTGGDAWSARRNAASPVMSALTNTSMSEPALTLMTRRGDVIFAFKQKEKGLLRQAYLAIAEMI
jgi:hypothetical protein